MKLSLFTDDYKRGHGGLWFVTLELIESPQITPSSSALSSAVSAKAERSTVPKTEPGTRVQKPKNENVSNFSLLESSSNTVSFEMTSFSGRLVLRRYSDDDNNDHHHAESTISTASAKVLNDANERVILEEHTENHASRLHPAKKEKSITQQFEKFAGEEDEVQFEKFAGEKEKVSISNWNWNLNSISNSEKVTNNEIAGNLTPFVDLPIGSLWETALGKLASSDNEDTIELKPEFFSSSSSCVSSIDNDTVSNRSGKQEEQENALSFQFKESPASTGETSSTSVSIHKNNTNDQNYNYNNQHNNQNDDDQLKSQQQNEQSAKPGYGDNTSSSDLSGAKVFPDVRPAPVFSSSLHSATSHASIPDDIQVGYRFGLKQYNSTNISMLSMNSFRGSGGGGRILQQNLHDLRLQEEEEQQSNNESNKVTNANNIKEVSTTEHVDFKLQVSDEYSLDNISTNKEGIATRRRKLNRQVSDDFLLDNISTDALHRQHQQQNTSSQSTFSSGDYKSPVAPITRRGRKRDALRSSRASNTSSQSTISFEDYKSPRPIKRRGRKREVLRSSAKMRSSTASKDSQKGKARKSWLGVHHNDQTIAKNMETFLARRYKGWSLNKVSIANRSSFSPILVSSGAATGNNITNSNSSLFQVCSTTGVRETLSSSGRKSLLSSEDSGRSGSKSIGSFSGKSGGENGTVQRSQKYSYLSNLQSVPERKISAKPVNADSRQGNTNYWDSSIGEEETPDDELAPQRSEGEISLDSTFNPAFVLKRFTSTKSLGKTSRNTELCTSKQIDYEAPTALHELCMKSYVTVEEVQAQVNQDPGAVSIQDSKGRIPLHVLADNDDLLSAPSGKVKAASIACLLMRIYPEGITVEDSDGSFPFVKVIRDWYTWLYGSHRCLPNERTSNMPRFRKKQGGDYFCEFFEDTIRLFPSVQIWDEVEWSIEMLSMVMDEFAGRNGTISLRNRRRLSLTGRSNSTQCRGENVRNQLVTRLALQMPTIIKIILLMDEDGGAKREKILKTSLFRRLLLCPESIGPWLPFMLRSKGTTGAKAIEYLSLISDLTVLDFIGEYRMMKNNDIEDFKIQYNLVMDAICSLNPIASLVVLDEKSIEKAASTKIVWQIMEKSLARPFSLALLLVDFVSHLILLLAFRFYASVRSNTHGRGDLLEIFPPLLVYCLCGQFILRKVCVGMTLLDLSVSVFASYSANFWNLSDFVSIALTVVAVMFRELNPSEYHYVFNTFVLGLLWLRVLGFLKVVNREMATFILSLTQILKDLWYFAFVMVVFILMLGDMMHLALTTKDNGQYCASIQDNEWFQGPIQSFCSGHLESYLRIYAMVVGDYSLDDSLYSPALLVLFGIVTLLGVVIMLNVLIAVISASYENATIESRVLFGRARVSFVAQNEALEEFLCPYNNPMQVFKSIKKPSFLLKTFVQIFRWTVLLSLIGTVIYVFYHGVTTTLVSFKLGEYDNGTVYLLIILLCILSPALCLLVLSVLGSLLESYLPDSILTIGFGELESWAETIVITAGSRLLGLGVVSDSESSSED